MKVNSSLHSLPAEPIQSQGNSSLNSAASLKPRPNDIKLKNEVSDKLSIVPNRQERLQKYASTIPAQNAASTLQRTDAVLNKIQTALQRGKELSKQANQEAITTQDKQKIQEQINQVNQEIDELSEAIPHNSLELAANLAVKNQDITDIITCLKSDWLESAEKVVADRYGLTGDGTELNIVMDESAANYLAALYYQTDPEDPSGKAINQTLHVAVPAITPATLPNGGNAPVYDDRIITHEMVHAIMGRTMNYRALPTWFKEGTAEFITGANERIAANLASAGGGLKGAAVIQNALGDGTDQTWANDSIHYSAATIAVRYLHDNIKANGHRGGIKDLMSDLKEHPSEDLNQALRHVSSYTSVAAFVNDFVDKNMGSVYIRRLDLARQFTTADTGAIGGSTVDGGPVLDAQSVVPDIYHYSDAPLKHFKIQWPDQVTDAGVVASELPLRQGQVTLSLFDSKSLGTKDTDVIKDPGGAIHAFDDAWSLVAQQRSQLDEVQKNIKQAIPSNPVDLGNVSAKAYQTNLKLPDQRAAYISAQAHQLPKRVLKLL